MYFRQRKVLLTTVLSSKIDIFFTKFNSFFNCSFGHKWFFDTFRDGRSSLLVSIRRIVRADTTASSGTSCFAFAEVIVGLL